MNNTQWCTKCRSVECSDPGHVIDNDLPAYLVFLVLANIRRLKRAAPDHILVKAVEDAIADDPPDNPLQGTLDL